MKSDIRLKCSEKYKTNLENTFNYVETTKEEKTIIVNDRFVCDFDPSLYVEQRIFRCLQDNNQVINESDKIKLMISLNLKTKRFLTDCDQSLFKDFANLSDVNGEKFYDQNSKIFEKSYNETMFEATFFSNITQSENVAIIKTTKRLLNKFNKSIPCLIESLKGFYNILDIEYFVVEIKSHNMNQKFKNILIYSLNSNLDDFYIFDCELDKHKQICYIKTKNNFKLTKIVSELKEYNSFD